MKFWHVFKRFNQNSYFLCFDSCEDKVQSFLHFRTDRGRCWQMVTSCLKTILVGCVMHGDDLAFRWGVSVRTLLHLCVQLFTFCIRIWSQIFQVALFFCQNIVSGLPAKQMQIFYFQFSPFQMSMLIGRKIKINPIGALNFCFFWQINRLCFSANRW